MSFSSDISRSPPFSLSDFQHLVSTAFDLPPNDVTSRDHHTPSLNPSFAEPSFTQSVDSHGPISPSPRPASSFSHLRSSSRTDRPRTPFGIFKSIRTRASALLRPTAPLPSLPPAITLTPSSRPSTARTARPSVSSQRTAILPLTQVDSNFSRPRTHSLPKSFLRLPKRDIPPPLPLKPENYASFFDDSDYNGTAVYPRSHSSMSRDRLHIHTRLPPLRKARPQVPSFFSKHSSKSNADDADCAPRSSYIFGQSLNDLDYNFEDPRCPSPFTSPRDAPQPPPMLEDELQVPAYVFDRRGSDTSTTTTSSVRTTSTLAERFSNAFPVSFSLPFASKSRSKLHLSIASSSPSTASSHSTSYGTPITPLSPSFQSTYTFPMAAEIGQVGASYGIIIENNTSRASFAETQQEALAIGRVLTPEQDPFAKPDIDVEDTTLKPLLSLDDMGRKRYSGRSSRRGSAQSEFVPRRHSKMDRPYYTPPHSRSLGPCNFPYATISPTYTFPSSCDVYPADISDASFAVPPSPSRSVRSTLSQADRNHPPSAWSTYSSPIMGCDASLASQEDGSEQDIQMADFPLPPASICGLPLGTNAGPAPRRPLPHPPITSFSASLPPSPITSLNGLGLESFDGSSSALAHRMHGPHLPLRIGRRDRGSLKSLPPVPNVYEVEECDLSSGEFLLRSSSGNRPASPFTSNRQSSDGSSKTCILQSNESRNLTSGRDRDGEYEATLDDSCVLGKDFLVGLRLRGVEQPEASFAVVEEEQRSFFSGSSEESVICTSEEEDIDRSIQDLLDDMVTDNTVTPVNLRSPSDPVKDSTVLPDHQEDDALDTSSLLSALPINDDDEDTVLFPRMRSDSFDGIDTETENWDRNTSRSTAFFSARSSLFSFTSTRRGSPDSWGTARVSMDAE
ncbi:unnamed protein product [Somion occarium]|uniref:Uncharacterized protein n=1 Tax=Somion occarium TaxID=3059160 RepID=A0ABP1CM46_9APHY